MKSCTEGSGASGALVSHIKLHKSLTPHDLSFYTELQFSEQFWIVGVLFCGTQVTIPGRWVLKMDRKLFKWNHFKQFLVQFLVVGVSFCGTKMTTLKTGIRFKIQLNG